MQTCDVWWGDARCVLECRCSVCWSTHCVLGCTLYWGVDVWAHTILRCTLHWDADVFAGMHTCCVGVHTVLGCRHGVRVHSLLGYTLCIGVYTVLGCILCIGVHTYWDADCAGLHTVYRRALCWDADGVLQCTLYWGADVCAGVHTVLGCSRVLWGRPCVLAC